MTSTLPKRAVRPWGRSRGVSALVFCLVMILGAAQAYAAGFSYSFRVLDEQGKEDGTARSKLTTGETGLLYKASEVKAPKLGRFLTHHVMKADYSMERFKTRPPGMGSRGSTLIYRKGRSMRVAVRSGDKASVSKIGATPGALIVDSRDPADYMLVYQKYGAAGGLVYVANDSASAEATVSEGEPLERRVAGRRARFTTKKVTLGASTGYLCYDSAGAFVAVEVNGVLAVINNHWKEISAKPVEPEAPVADDEDAPDADIEEKRIEKDSTPPDGDHGP
jgi:hypothetical protein